MSPNLRTARKQLGYPLYGADFDPSNPDFLLVGGGGGSTSSGVPNKISLLDVSRLETLHEITDINLAKNEDSVTCLAIANSDAGSMIAYAGINSSIKDQEMGKNEHFRSFRIGLPSKKRKTETSEKTPADRSPGIVKTEALTRVGLFKSASGPKSDAYQRVLRVAPARKDGGEQLAAVASGLATKNEVLVLRVAPSPGVSDVVSRIDVENGEAADLDLIPVEDEAKSDTLAYCTDYDVFLQHLPSSKRSNVKEPVKVWSTPSTDRRSKIRCLRWLNSRYILLLGNRPAGGGAVLVILKTDTEFTHAQVALEKVVAKSTKQAVGLATCALSASGGGDRQYLVAIAGQDSSLEILSIDILADSGPGNFKQYAHLRDVHSGPITRITFSNFQAPTLPVSKDTKPQYVRLASVGVDLNVVVQTLPLRPYPAMYTDRPRYVLVPPAETLQNAINVFRALAIVGLVGFLLQVFCEIRGVLPPTLHAQSWLSPKWQHKLAIPYPYNAYQGRPFDGMPGPVIPASLPPLVESVVSAGSETATQAATLLQDLVAEQRTNPEMQTQQIVCRDNPDAAADDTSNCDIELHDRDSDTVQKDRDIKKWDQLSDVEKRGWKKRLIQAGHWTEKQGETVLKGILFSELGAAVRAGLQN